MDNTGFFMQSKSESKASYQPLAPEDYIVKLAKIDLVLKDNYHKTAKEWNYDVICLVYKLKADDGIFDVEGKEVKPLTVRLWKQLNPNSLGFQNDGTPSIFRQFLAIMTDSSNTITDRLEMPWVVIVNKTSNQEVIGDLAVEYKEKYLAYTSWEMNSEDFSKYREESQLFHLPEIRMFEGKYLAAKISIGTKQDGTPKNTIQALGTLPKSFNGPDLKIEEEAMKKFHEKLREQRNKSSGTAQTEVIKDEEIKDEDTIDMDWGPKF